MLRTTQRLILQSATIELAQTELASLDTLASLLQAVIPAGWPPGEYDRDAQEFFLHRLRQGTNHTQGWYSWYAIHREGLARTLIGAGGFLGPPDESGRVEMGFSIHPAWNGRGFATEMAGELVSFAFEDKRVHCIVGNTTLIHVASCRVFRRLGFVEDASASDPQAVCFVRTAQGAPA